MSGGSESNASGTLQVYLLNVMGGGGAERQYEESGTRKRRGNLTASRTLTSVELTQGAEPKWLICRRNSLSIVFIQHPLGKHREQHLQTSQNGGSRKREKIIPCELDITFPSRLCLVKPLGPP